MLEFLSQNWGSLLTGGTLLAVVVFLVIKLVRDRKNGKSCSGCGGCSKAGSCSKNNGINHNQKDRKE